MKISTATRDRLRALQGDRGSLESVVVDALDVYEREQFWAQAETAVGRESAADRRDRLDREAEYDRWLADAQ